MFYEKFGFQYDYDDFERFRDCFEHEFDTLELIQKLERQSFKSEQKDILLSILYELKLESTKIISMKDLVSLYEIKIDPKTCLDFETFYFFTTLIPAKCKDASDLKVKLYSRFNWYSQPMSRRPHDV